MNGDICMESRLISRLIAYFGTDTRRVGHALKVYGYAKALSEDLSQEQRPTLLAAAILHDIGIRNAESKYGSGSGELQEREGPPVAREILAKEGAAPEFIERVCYLIGHHHSYTKIDAEDFQMLVEADFLVNIEEEQLPESAIRQIRDQYFKTTRGLCFIHTLYDV